MIDGRVFAVADGMGGHKGGEVAAQIVVDQLRSLAPGTQTTVSGASAGTGTGDDDDPDTAVLEMPLVLDHRRDPMDPGLTASNASPEPEPELESGREAGTNERTNEDPPTLTPERLVEIVQRANIVVLTRASQDRDLHGMGTTLTAIGLVESPGADGQGEELLAVINVGDSRTYWMRQGQLEQLTEDHSIVAELIRDGRLTPEEARNHRQRSVLTRALGVERDVAVDVIEVIPVVGNRFLACSDGLFSEVPDEIIVAILRRLADPDEAARELVRTAIERGGRDNVSVVVVDVIDDDHLAERASATVAGMDRIRSTRAARASQDESHTQRNAGPKGAPAKARRRDRPRTPWPVNLRVILFLAVIAGLIGAVAWVWRNAPAGDGTTDTSVATSVVPSTTAAEATTDAETTTTSAPVTTRVLTLPTTTVLLVLQATAPATTVAAPTLAPPPSTTADPFGPAPSSTKAA